MKKQWVKFFFVGLFLIVFSGCGGGSNDKPEVALDSSINPFSITSVVDVEPSAEITSNTVTITGINLAVPVSVDGCSYSLNGADFQSDEGTVVQGDRLSFQIEAPSEFLTSASCEINVAQFNSQFTVTTRDALVRVDVTVKSSSIEEVRIVPTKLVIHDSVGQNQREVEITSTSTLIPDSTNGISYTLYATTGSYGYTYHNLFTKYNANGEQVHRIIPSDGSHFFEDCKTVSLTSSAVQQTGASVGFYTASQCNSIIGKSSYERSVSLALDLSNINTNEFDLVYFERAANANIVGYKLLSSENYQSGDIVNADDLVLDDTFGSLSVIKDIDYYGGYRVYGINEDSSLGLLLGEGSVQQGANNMLVNLIDLSYPKYKISQTLVNQAQYYHYSKIETIIPNIDDRVHEPKFMQTVNLTDNLLSWTVFDNYQYEMANIKITNSVDGNEYKWVIDVNDTGSVTLPEIESVNTQVFLNGATMRIFLLNKDDELKETEGVWTSFYLNCVDDICDFDASLP